LIHDASFYSCLHTDSDGYTPLHYAVESKDTESISIILKCLLRHLPSLRPHQLDGQVPGCFPQACPRLLSR
jgi:hypothetical protein